VRFARENHGLVRESTRLACENEGLAPGSTRLACENEGLVRESTRFACENDRLVPGSTRLACENDRLAPESTRRSLRRAWLGLGIRQDVPDYSRDGPVYPPGWGDASSGLSSGCSARIASMREGMGMCEMHAPMRPAFVWAPRRHARAVPGDTCSSAAHSEVRPTGSTGQSHSAETSSLAPLGESRSSSARAMGSVLHMRW